jgi:hypothetical protein
MRSQFRIFWKAKRVVYHIYFSCSDRAICRTVASRKLQQTRICEANDATLVITTRHLLR